MSPVAFALKNEVVPGSANLQQVILAVFALERNRCAGALAVELGQYFRDSPVVEPMLVAEHVADCYIVVVRAEPAGVAYERVRGAVDSHDGFPFGGSAGLGAEDDEFDVGGSEEPEGPAHIQGEVGVIPVDEGPDNEGAGRQLHPDDMAGVQVSFGGRNDDDGGGGDHGTLLAGEGVQVDDVCDLTNREAAGLAVAGDADLAGTPAVQDADQASAVGEDETDTAALVGSSGGAGERGRRSGGGGGGERHGTIISRSLTSRQAKEM